MAVVTNMQAANLTGIRVRHQDDTGKETGLLALTTAWATLTPASSNRLAMSMVTSANPSAPMCNMPGAHHI